MYKMLEEQDLEALKTVVIKLESNAKVARKTGLSKSQIGRILDSKPGKAITTKTWEKLEPVITPYLKDIPQKKETLIQSNKCPLPENDECPLPSNIMDNLYYAAAVKELAGMSKDHIFEVLTLIEKLKKEEERKKLGEEEGECRANTA